MLECVCYREKRKDMSPFDLKHIGVIVMAKNSYETKLVNLVKKSDSIRGCVKDGYINMSIDDHAIIKMVDSTYNGMLLSKMGIYYIKTNAGKYDKIKGNFVQVLYNVPDKLTKLLDFEKEEIFI